VYTNQYPISNTLGRGISYEEEFNLFLLSSREIFSWVKRMNTKRKKLGFITESCNFLVSIVKTRLYSGSERYSLPKDAFSLHLLSLFLFFSLIVDLLNT
jgi:hypothetical protein